VALDPLLAWRDEAAAAGDVATRVVLAGTAAIVPEFLALGVGEAAALEGHGAVLQAVRRSITSLRATKKVTTVAGHVIISISTLLDFTLRSSGQSLKWRPSELPTSKQPMNQ